MSNFVETVLKYIYPPRCPFCGEIVPEQHPCVSCKEEWENGGENIEAVLQKLPVQHIDEYYACTIYAGKVRAGLHRLKFENAYTLLPFFAEQMISILPVYATEEVILIPVPQSEKRESEAAVHIPLMLAEYIGGRTGLQVTKSALRKVKETKLQHSLTREERLQNLTGAFELQNEQQIQNKTVFLCDDIVTTGATLTECAKILKIHGAKQVYGICFAATPFEE